MQCPRFHTRGRGVVSNRIGTSILPGHSDCVQSHLCSLHRISRGIPGSSSIPLRNRKPCTACDFYRSIGCRISTLSSRVLMLVRLVPRMRSRLVQPIINPTGSLKSSMECLPFYESEVDGDEKQWHRSQKATMHTIKTANEKNPIEDIRILVNPLHQHILCLTRPVSGLLKLVPFL